MAEIPLYPLWMTVFLTLWAAIGPVAGIFIGHLLARSWERRKWLADNKRDEYREVLKALTAALSPVIQCVKPGLRVGDKEVMARIEAMNLTNETIESRIFIHQDLESLDLYRRWATPVSDYEKHHDDKIFAGGFKVLLDELRAKALKSH